MNDAGILAIGLMLGGVISYAYFNLSEMIKAIQRSIDDWEDEPEITMTMVSDDFDNKTLLQQAIEREDYEESARLRDLIEEENKE